jgi:hypothetical protein
MGVTESDKEQYVTLKSGPNTIKLFMVKFINACNKLECWHLASLSTLS